MTIGFAWGIDLVEMPTRLEFAHAPIDCLSADTKVRLDLLGRAGSFTELQECFLPFVVGHFLLNPSSG
jgi:hypothetical protein